LVSRFVGYWGRKHAAKARPRRHRLSEQESPSLFQ